MVDIPIMDLHKIKRTSGEIDAIVVGAGPAGAECARELSKRGRRVVIMERSQHIGEPNFSTAGTPRETIEDFGLPKSVVKGSWSTISVRANDDAAVWDYKKTRGYVFDFKELKRFLVKDAVAHGARVMVGTAALAPVVEKGIVVGVRYGGISGTGELRAKVVIDASGPVGVLASQLKLRKPFPCPPGAAIESIVDDKAVVRSLKRLSGTISFYFGDDYVAHGYGWIFSFGKDAFKVGCCVNRAADHGIAKFDHSDMMVVFRKFLGKFPEFDNLQLLDLHGGDVFLVPGGLERSSLDGFLAIGDAAFQINPLGGEGIRHCLHSGRSAAAVVDEAIFRNDVSKKMLSRYDAAWRAYIGIKWKESFKISKRMYEDFTAPQWKKIMGFLARLSPEELFAVAFGYHYARMIKFGRLWKLAALWKNLSAVRKRP